MAYTAGQAAFDIAVTLGWTLLGLVGGYYYWATHSSQGTQNGCGPSGAMCE